LPVLLSTLLLPLFWRDEQTYLRSLFCLSGHCRGLCVGAFGSCRCRGMTCWRKRLCLFMRAITTTMRASSPPARCFRLLLPAMGGRAGCYATHLWYGRDRRTKVTLPSTVYPIAKLANIYRRKTGHGALAENISAGLLCCLLHALVRLGRCVPAALCSPCKASNSLRRMANSTRWQRMRSFGVALINALSLSPLNLCLYRRRLTLFAACPPSHVAAWRHHHAYLRAVSCVCIWYPAMARGF